MKVKSPPPKLSSVTSPCGGTQLVWLILGESACLEGIHEPLVWVQASFWCCVLQLKSLAPVSGFSVLLLPKEFWPAKS